MYIMGEDAQIEDADEGYGLSPALDESARFTEPEGVICSVDGSYATSKYATKRNESQEELRPCSELTLDHPRSIRSAMSRESMAFQSGIVYDESRPILANISRRSQILVQHNGSTIRLPQPLDTPLQLQKSQANRSKSILRPGSAKCREISPIRVVSTESNATRNAQLYDPLRKISNETTDSRDPIFSAELEIQERKLMNGLKAIMNYCGKQARPVSTASSAPTLATAITRSGSASTVSTGRDPLSKEVRDLKEAFADMNVAKRAAAGRNRDETADSFAMDEMLTIERPPSGSRASSTIEQARLSSLHLLADNAIRDADQCTKALRSGALNYLVEKATSTQGETETKCVKYHVITHRIKSAPEHHKHHRRHSVSSTSDGHKPVYPTFTLDRLNMFDGSSALEKRFDPRSNMFDGTEARLTIHDNELDHASHQQRRYGGKRGRPIVIGRAIYGRGRMHFRPTASHQSSPRVAQTAHVTEVHSSVPEHRDVATLTEHECAVQTESQPTAEEIAPKDEVEELVEEDTESTITPESVKHHVHHKKPPVPKKMPFVSGQKGNSTFSIAGNQQQVMKIIGTRFQEWLPLARSIIYDSHCKDYAKALYRDLVRQKRSHMEQMRLLEVDLDAARNDNVRREIREDIARLRQQWTHKHDRVVARLNEQLSRGGIWSKVQQLRVIYAALVA